MRYIFATDIFAVYNTITVLRKLTRGTFAEMQIAIEIFAVHAVYLIYVVIIRSRVDVP